MKTIVNLIKQYSTFLKYIISAGISFTIDITLFSVFSFFLKEYIDASAIFVATILARMISSFINYFLNRNGVFQKNDKKIDSNTLIKYYLLVVIQMLISATVVYNLYQAIHTNETIIKIPVEIILFLINYIIQKKFIFNDKTKKSNVPKKYHMVICAVGSIFTTFALLFQVTEQGLKFYRSNTMMITYMVLSIGLFVFYKQYLGKYNSKTTYKIISILFALLMVFGYSYDIVHNASLVWGNISLLAFSILKGIGYYLLFNTSLHLLDNIIMTKQMKEVKLPKILRFFDSHPFLFSFIVIVICYLPYIIAYYPVIINYDAANQVKEIMGMPTRYMDSVVLLNPNNTITNFNPIIHTFMIGGFFRLGHCIGNVNLGMFLYSIVQICIVVSVFAYSIFYLNKIKVNKILIFLVLAIYALVPLFPFYAMTAVKDVIFSALILLYIIKMYDIIKYKQTAKQYFLFGLLVLFIILFRNNGIYTIVLSLPFLCLLKKEIRKPLLIVLVANVGLYLGYNKVLLPKLEIANTSIREVLSVPFQQTARHVKYYGDEISAKDRRIIDKVLTYDTLGERYRHDLSDPVKNEYNKYTKDEELKEYFGVWFKYLWQRPVVYIDATINNIYGYFYPNTSAWYIYTDLNHKLPEAGFDYHYNGLNGLRLVLKGYGESFPYIPILGTIANIGLVVWIHILLVGMLIVHHAKKYIILLLPSLSFILVCMASPANTYFRYVLPCVFALPAILCLLYKELKHN